MSIIDLTSSTLIANIPDAFTYNGTYRNHDETFQSMQAFDDGTFLFLHNAWNNSIGDDDLYFVRRDANFNQLGVMKITAGGHGGSMSAHKQDGVITITTTLGLDKVGYPAFVSEFEYKEGATVDVRSSDFKHLKDYPVGAAPQCAVQSNDLSLVGALEDDWSRYRVYKANNLNNYITEMTTSKFVIGSNNVIQSYCIYDDMIFASLGGPGPRLSNSDEMNKDPRGIAVVDAIKGETIEKHTLDMRALGCPVVDDKVEPEGITVINDTLYVAFRTGDNQAARIIVYKFKLMQTETPVTSTATPLPTINLTEWSGDVNTFYETNLSNFRQLQNFVEIWNRNAEIDFMYEPIYVELDVTDYGDINRQVYRQFVDNCNKINKFLPELCNDYILDDFEIVTPDIPATVNFDKDAINNYWTVVQNNVNHLIEQVEAQSVFEEV